MTIEQLTGIANLYVNGLITDEQAKKMLTGDVDA